MKSRAIFGILILSGLLRFWRLDVPREVVFDEVHYGKFVNAYAVTKERFFDVHPPLPKLVMALAAKASGAKPFSFERIGLPYGDLPIFWLRFPQAVIGTLLPVLLFLLLLELGLSHRSSFFGALIMTLENATIVETRLILLDGYLVFGILATLFSVLKAKNGSLIWAALAGVAAASALLTKYTGLVALIAPIGWCLAWNRRRILQLALFLLGGSALYLIVWRIHFSILTLPGFGDSFTRPTGAFFHDLWALQVEMFRANARISAGHPDQSPWWAWPWMRTPPFYWTRGSAFLYLFGNVAVWWGECLIAPFIAIGVVQKLTAQALTLSVKTALTNPATLPFLLYLASFLPLSLVKRPLFLYHYLPSLWLLALVIFVRFDSFFIRWRALVMAVVILGFLFALPLTYGLEMPRGYLTLLYWRPEWLKYNGAFGF